MGLLHFTGLIERQRRLEEITKSAISGDSSSSEEIELQKPEMNTNEFINFANKNGFSDKKKINVRAICADGFSLEIQAGYGFDSIPGHQHSKYMRVQVNNPSEVDKELLPFMNKELDINFLPIEQDPTKSKFSFVPVALLDKILAIHGGIVSAK
jgi:hypothetical protein